MSSARSPLAAVVFDLDGLMFNTEDLYQQSGHEVLARRGKTLTPELLDQLMGRQAHKAIQIMIDWHQLDVTPEELTAESIEILFALVAERLTPMPGLLELLDHLETANLPKGIATGSSRMFVDRVLEQSELTERFEFVLAAEDVEHGKPAPDVYLLAASKHGLPPEQILVLEDSQLGCQAAVAANTFAVAVPNGHSETHSFAGVQFIADSLSDQRIYDALGIVRQST